MSRSPWINNLPWINLPWIAAVAAAAAAATTGGCAAPPRIGDSSYPLPPARLESTGLPEQPAHPPTSPAPPTPQDPGRLDLSLEEATFLALQHNRDLAIELRAPIVAGAFEDIERGRFSTEVFAGARYAEEAASEAARATGEKFTVEGQDSALSAGVRRRLASGTDVELGVEQSRSLSDRTPEQQELRAGLSVTQQLLRGFGPSVNLAAVRQAEWGTLSSAYEVRGFTEALIADTEIAYWEYVLAQETIAIFNQSLEVAEQQLDDIDQRIEVGALAENDAAAARAEVARRQQALIEARSQREAARLRLLQRVYPQGLREPDLQVLPLSQPRIPAEPIPDLPDRLELALSMRPDLNEARLRLAQQRLETVVTRNGLLPRLDLFIALGKSGYAESFSESYRDLDQDSYDFRVGIELVHELGNRTGRARERLAAAELEQALLAVENLGDLVRLDVRLAANEVERARRQIAASAVTRIFEEASLRAERERFDVGSGTALLVAQAQRDLLASQIAEVQSIVTYRIATVNLLLAEGSLLERRGITTTSILEVPR